MFNNRYYEALVEGRYQPRITVERDSDGSYKASYADANGVEVTYSDASQSEAFRRCNDMVVEGVRTGKIVPFK